MGIYLLLQISSIFIMAGVIAAPESLKLANELLAEGKRDLLVHAIPDAVFLVELLVDLPASLRTVLHLLPPFQKMRVEH